MVAEVSESVVGNCQLYPSLKKKNIIDGFHVKEFQLEEKTSRPLWGEYHYAAINTRGSPSKGVSFVGSFVAGPSAEDGS